MTVEQPTPPVVLAPVWDNIPASLAQRQQWVLWKFEWDAKREAWLKMPHYAMGGVRNKGQGSDSDRLQLAKLEVVRRVFEKRPGVYAGVGFGFLPGDGLIGIDLDKQIDPATGAMSDRCRNIIDAFATYTETSPSGTGVHLYVLGHTNTAKSNDIGVEMFCGKQYFTVTGHHVAGTPLEVVEANEAAIRRMHVTIQDAKDAHKAKTSAPTSARAAPVPAAPGQQGGTGDFRKVNDAAMAALHAWVPQLFGGREYVRGDGYRVTSKALGRSLQEDLSIDPKGIVDFGVADMGDPRQGARTPVDVVMEWLPTSKPKEALHWLAQRLGVVLEPAKPRDVPAERTPAVGEGATAEPAASAPAPTPGNVVPLHPPKVKPKKEKPEPDWGKLDHVLEHFRLIYGTDMVWDGSKRLTMKVAAMAHALGTETVRMWKAHPERRMVMQDDMVFDPTGTCDPDQCVNLYNGFAMEPDPTDPQDIEVMLELLRHLCGNCSTDGVTIDQVMHWVLCWLALPLQQPGAKLKTALVFHGPQGTGKNLFFDAVRSIYGGYGVMVGQNELEEKYTSWLSAKLMVIGNEVVTRQELYHNKNKLKWVISEEVIPIRAMNMDVRWERNHANVVFLSNEQMPLVLEDGDRRYLVVYTPLAEDGDLYKRVAAFLAWNGAAKLLHYLQNYDIGDFTEHSKPIMTAAKADLIELGMRPSERFMSEWVQGFLALPMNACSAEQLYRAFRRWCEQAGERYPPPRAQFTKNAQRWITERVERDAQGKALEPKLTYKVVQLKDATGARSAARCWLPRGTGPLNGVSEGEWASDAVHAFEGPLNRFCRVFSEGGSKSPVTPDA